MNIYFFIWTAFITVFSGINWIINPESVVFAFLTGLYIGLTFFYANLLNDED